MYLSCFYGFYVWSVGSFVSLFIMIRLLISRLIQFSIIINQMFFHSISIILLSVLASLVSTELIPLDSQTIEKVFKYKNNAFILLLGDEEKQSLAFGSFARFVLSHPDLDIITAVSRRDDGTGLFQKVVEHIGVSKHQTPHILYINEQGFKYKFDNQKQFNPDNIQQFFNKAKNGQLHHFLKSEQQPFTAQGHIITLVASNFQEEVFKTQKEVLVKFYAPWCYHCKKMVKQYQKTAQIMSRNPNILIAEIDASANQIPSVKIQGYPTIKFWGKDKSKPSIEFHGERTSQNFVNFLKENTEYDWVDLKVEKWQNYSEWQEEL